MELTPNGKFYKMGYDRHWISIFQLQELVEYEVITEQDYFLITGETYKKKEK